MATGTHQAAPTLTLARRSRAQDAMVAGLVVFAAYHLGLAVWMAAFPHTFFDRVGPFGLRNDHYIRDNATFNAAIGVAFALAVRRPSWRVPVLALTTVQFALHSINHLADIGKSHPAWNGPADFGALSASTVLLAWLLRGAIRAEQPPSPLRSAGGART